MSSRAFGWVVVLLLGAGVVPTSAQNGPRSCALSSQNLYVRDVMLDLYLWRQNMPDVDATAFRSPEDYLEAVRYRELDSRFSYITSAASSNAFYSDNWDQAKVRIRVRAETVFGAVEVHRDR